MTITLSEDQQRRNGSISESTDTKSSRCQKWMLKLESHRFSWNQHIVGWLKTGLSNQKRSINIITVTPDSKVKLAVFGCPFLSSKLKLKLVEKIGHFRLRSSAWKSTILTLNRSLLTLALFHTCFLVSNHWGILSEKIRKFRNEISSNLESFRIIESREDIQQFLDQKRQRLLMKRNFKDLLMKILRVNSLILSFCTI